MWEEGVDGNAEVETRKREIAGRRAGGGGERAPGGATHHFLNDGLRLSGLQLLLHLLFH